MKMRNKIHLAKDISYIQQEECCVIDVGRILAKEAEKDFKKFVTESNFDSFIYFRQILDSFIDYKKKYLVFSNIGILLETHFSLDVPRFLLEYAKDFQVFIIQGIFNYIDRNKLTWNVENPYNVIEFNDGVLEVIPNGGDI